MRIIKPLIGVILIVVSAVGLIWWEKEGRQELLMVDILVAKEPMEKGDKVGREHFQEIKIMKENLIDGALGKESLQKLEGKIANQYIPKNSQINSKMLLAQEDLVDTEQSIFELKPWWIYSRSSSLRKGDVIDIFDSKGEIYLGSYKVAYVRDEQEQEIVNVEGSKGKEVLQREFSTGVINHVEIIAHMEEYEKLRQLAEEQGVSFLLVQKGV